MCGLLLWATVQTWVFFPQLLPPFPASTLEGPGPLCAQTTAQVKVKEDLFCRVTVSVVAWCYTTALTQGPEDRGSVFYLLPFPAPSDYVHESGCQEEASALREHSGCPMEPTLGSSMGGSVAVTRAAHNYSQDVFLPRRSQENVRKSLVQWAKCLLHNVCS